jgi:MYXO-CTERM domain-containing protein
MNNLKLLGLTAGVGSLILAGTAVADFTGMQYETVENGMAGLTTYLVYAGVDAGGELDAVYGDNVNALSVSSDGGFYQNTFGSWSTPNAALFPIFPSLAYDSFVTIGLLDDGGDAMLSIGIDYSNFDAGGAIYTENGTWFATPDDAQVFEIDGRVLVGQFTVGDGDHVYGSMSFQGKNADGTNWESFGVNFDTAPAPGALALLGLAGLATRRRRK